MTHYPWTLKHGLRLMSLSDSFGTNWKEPTMPRSSKWIISRDFRPQIQNGIMWTSAFITPFLQYCLKDRQPSYLASLSCLRREIVEWLTL